ncbi:hypothetical protein AK812_SmicGene16373 [Symbiodinium microadriaticum]|uniref:Uncharacterized protein n=1 Tax=Symbiodinium microadriaticum TaxID=2951 RepID=A0A1Q9E0I2_SYMMI|nr:hypothetical protein AK812_SmicGene16373 [Symbiodinium microadriaticum]
MVSFRHALADRWRELRLDTIYFSADMRRRWVLTGIPRADSIELEQVVDVGNKTFRSCLLGDEGQEGREELLVACVQVASNSLSRFWNLKVQQAMEWMGERRAWITEAEGILGKLHRAG